MWHLPSIRQYLLVSALTKFSIMAIGSVYSPFMKAHGLDDQHIHLVNAWFFLTMLVLEIPSGAAADILGRTRCVKLSYLFLTLSMFAYAVSSTFAGFVTSEILAATGTCFGNGSYQAWAMRELEKNGQSALRNKVISLQSALSSFAAILGSVAGGYIANIGYSATWFTADTLFLVTFIMVYRTMKSDRRIRKHGLRRSLCLLQRKMVRSLCYAKSDPELRIILFLIFSFALGVTVANMQWSLWFQSTFGISRAGLGWVLGTMMLGVTTGSVLVLRFGHRLPKQQEGVALFGIIAVIGSGIFLTTSLRIFSLSLGVFLFHEIGRGMYAPLRDIYLNGRIPESKRATLLSISSIPNHVGSIIGLVGSGYLIKQTSSQLAWHGTGLFLIIVAIGLIIVTKKR